MAIKGFFGPHRWLSNFYPLPDGTTVEHHYQAAKALHPGDRTWILDAPTPGVAKRRGATVALRSDWEEVKTTVMLDLLREKFTDPVLREKLLATGHDYLEEANTWGDTYWGTVNGWGENMLGKLLMQVRMEIRTENRLRTLPLEDPTKSPTQQKKQK